jgi:hypothetical protein
MMAGKERVIGGGLKNKLQVTASRFMPDSMKAEKHRDLAEPGSAEEDSK